MIRKEMKNTPLPIDKLLTTSICGIRGPVNDKKDHGDTQTLACMLIFVQLFIHLNEDY